MGSPVRCFIQPPPSAYTFRIDTLNSIPPLPIIYTCIFESNSNQLVPIIGLGTAGLGPNKAASIIEHGFKVGYRLIDTASDTGPWYKTESIIASIMHNITKNTSLDGTTLRKSTFLTTKLHPQDFTPERAKNSFEKSLSNLQTNYIDLYLLHYPSCRNSTSLCPDANGKEGSWRDIWPLLEEWYSLGRIRAIGVSNFNLLELQEMLGTVRIKPHIVQSWFDPHHQNWTLFKYCQYHGIAFEAYSALGTQWHYIQSSTQQSKPQNPILSSPVLKKIAQDTKKSIAQVVLRWLVQEGIIVIPRTSSHEHLEENTDIWDFNLSILQIAQIRQLDRSSNVQVDVS